MSKRTSILFRAARTSADVDAVASGSPRKMLRRGKNKFVGRGLGSFWKQLWR